MAMWSRSKRFKRIGERISDGFQQGMEDGNEFRCKGPYRLAFIAYNGALTMTYLRELAQLNHGRIQNQRVWLEDGTQIFPVVNARSWYGQRFDQVVVADDRRGLIRENPDFWEKMKMVERHRSHKIPDDFFAQYYDLDAELTNTHDFVWEGGGRDG